ncbi:hypothetical protein MGWOODY_Smn857 [hydrothermal vent metagenome]|uniref:Uncharacterized protein n=1 Tax=hydrothermal vent metagenome TaxID=652676 RepID=A0A160TLW3_9ZZZZ
MVIASPVIVWIATGTRWLFSLRRWAVTTMSGSASVSSAGVAAVSASAVAEALAVVSAFATPGDSIAMRNAPADAVQNNRTVALDSVTMENPHLLR